MLAPTGEMSWWRSLPGDGIESPSAWDAFQVVLAAIGEDKIRADLSLIHI